MPAQASPSGTQVVRYRQVRRDEAVSADRRAGERDLEEAARAARASCRADDHRRIKLSGRRRFCVWCGELG